MAEFILDFSEAQEFDSSPVPAGVYNCIIDASFAQEVKIGKAKGTPYITLGFRIVDGEYENRMIFQNYMIAGKGAGALKRLLRDFGYYSESDGDRIKFNPAVLDGLDCRVKVKIRALDDGTEVNDVQLVVPIDNAAQEKGY